MTDRQQYPPGTSVRWTQMPGLIFRTNREGMLRFINEHMDSHRKVVEIQDDRGDYTMLAWSDDLEVVPSKGEALKMVIELLDATYNARGIALWLGQANWNLQGNAPVELIDDEQMRLDVIDEARRAASV